MTLTSIKPYLQQAQAKGFAIPLFDVFEIQGAAGVLDAIHEKNAPVILGVYAKIILDPETSAFVAYLKRVAEQSPLPIALMLDHGADMAQCQQAVKLGFTDLMFDGSSLPLAENIAQTRAIVQMAHEAGMGVEAELGHVGQAGQDESHTSSGYTDPDTVPEFAAETGVDFLAVAFGTSHGVSKGSPPHLNVELLREIHQKTSLPLVMHGGSGLTDQQFKESIASGISKINVSTNLLHAAARGMKADAARDDADLFSIMAAARKGYRQTCADILDLFGTSHQGNKMS